MSVAPDPAEIFHRAAEEGERRLNQSTLELVSTSFIAGFTIVFGLVALGIVHALVKPRFGEVSQVAGALAFGTALVFLVISTAGNLVGGLNLVTLTHLAQARGAEES